MKIWSTLETQYEENTKKNAGGKAREDLNLIFKELGIKELNISAPQKERKKANIIKKLCYHYNVEKIWEGAVDQISSGDTWIIQFPVVNHTLLLREVIRKAKKRKIKIIAFIHDLEILRLSNADKISIFEKWRMKREELDELYLFDYLVVHNKQMQKYINEQLNIPIEKIVVLQIFDYLIPGNYKHSKVKQMQMKNCIIAGNLLHNKAGYVYKLPSLPDFELYGINYDKYENKDNIHYHGAFLADELPYYMQGGFGLVWDGNETKTCAGAWGKYLMYNNPHKVSLYLACGVPVIIWEKAAMAEFVISNKVGITIKSLDELSEKIDEISYMQYEKMERNAVQISQKLRTGYYTREALKAIGIELKEWQ